MLPAKEKAATAGASTPIVQKQIKKWLSDQYLADALESYRKNGKAAWEILFREKPEAWLRAIMCLLPADDVIDPMALRVVVTGVPRPEDDVKALPPPNEH